LEDSVHTVATQGGKIISDSVSNIHQSKILKIE
jgi:hypothetical protein